MRKTLVRLLPCIVAGSFFHATAVAGVIYNNFGLDSSFNPNTGQTVSSTSTGLDVRPSFELNFGAGGFIQEIDFVASINSGDTDNSVTLTISQDSSGHPNPDTGALATTTFTNAMGVLGVSSGILAWTNIDLSLAPGIYWLTFDGPIDSSVSWNLNTTGASGLDIYSAGSWQAKTNTLGALLIDGTLAPEPSSIALGGIAGLALLFARRRVACQRG